MLVIKVTQNSYKSIPLSDSSVKSPSDTSIPGAVDDNRSNYSFRIWEKIVEKAGIEGEVIQGDTAEEVDCSTRTVQRLLKDFERCNLIEYESYNGQGRGVLVKNLWLEEAKKRKSRRSWSKGYDREDEFLKERYTRGGRLGTTSLANKGILEQTKTKDRDLGRGPSIKNSQNSTNPQGRLQWLHKQNGFQRTSSRKSFQAIIMWDLRTSAEDSNLSLEEVKPLCDRFWMDVKDKPLQYARSALKYLKEKIGKFVDKIKSEDINGIKDLYRLAEKFISHKIMRLIPGYGDSRVRTHESLEEDKKKRDEVRSRGVSPIFNQMSSEIFETPNSDDGSKASGNHPTEEPPNGGDNSSTLKVRGSEDSGWSTRLVDREPMKDNQSAGGEESEFNPGTAEKVLTNYGLSGLKSWCKRKGLEFNRVKENISRS